MLRKKYDYAVMHIQSGNYVTDIGDNEMVYLKAGEQAKLFPKRCARALADELTRKGHTALVVEVPPNVSDLRNAIVKKEDDNNG